jgi:hypothetical protein
VISTTPQTERGIASEAICNLLKNSISLCFSNSLLLCRNGVQRKVASLSFFVPLSKAAGDFLIFSNTSAVLRETLIKKIAKVKIHDLSFFIGITRGYIPNLP